MEENIIVIKDPKTFCFNFDWLKYEIGQSLLKYKHGNNIHEHGNLQWSGTAKQMNDINLLLTCHKD